VRLAERLRRTAGRRYNKTIARKLVGDHLWAVKEAQNGERYVALFLLERDHGHWGYKDLDESMGPNAVDCPLRFLELATAKPTGYAAAWRERVREFHQGKEAA
jgi:hypothetical protein